MRDRIAAALMVVCLLGFVAALGTAIVTGVMLVWRKAGGGRGDAVVTAEPPSTRPAPTALPPPPRPTRAVAASARPAPTPATAETSARCTNPPVIDDDTRLEPMANALTAVDAQAIFPAVKRMALNMDPDVELQSVVAHGVRHGTVDLSGRGVILYHFQYIRNAGLDDRESGTIDVTAGCWGLYAKRDRFVRVERHNQYDRVLDPQCSVAKAWRAVVASGVAEESVLDLEYRDDDPLVRGSPSVWSFNDPDEPTLEREIHGQTCGLVRSFATGRPIPPLSPPPTPSAPPRPARRAADADPFE